MSEVSSRFRMPFILPGQAQKELFHNEAVAVADGLLHAAVESGLTAEPPASPEPGQAWLVGPGATGAWNGMINSLALWTEAGWRFVAPVEGMVVWEKSSKLWVHWTGALWRAGEVPATKIIIGGLQVVGERQPEITSPSGGTIIDEEARAAITAVIVAFKTHGLTE